MATKVRSASGLLLGVLLLAIPAWAQTGSVIGVVTDPSHKPIIGCRVTAVHAQQEAATDVDGNFVIHDLPVGRDTLHFQSLGYQRLRCIVTVKPDTQSVFHLKLSELPLYPERSYKKRLKRVHWMKHPKVLFQPKMGTLHDGTAPRPIQ
jgi:hypothetical protein